ncbi:hypothetical protein EVG20_g3553 [Dentipellis fragilis]|uniref:Uncharacterized protein n=1 Tax=Dentipellis fragilis TaxID=205917 RepID=A0A4Y9Z325_9AGAM|nr:hypothetical protein EVG20_g3553 [Dentipellis fragilis]
MLARDTAVVPRCHNEGRLWIATSARCPGQCPFATSAILCDSRFFLLAMCPLPRSHLLVPSCPNPLAHSHKHAASDLSRSLLPPLSSTRSEGRERYPPTRTTPSSLITRDETLMFAGGGTTSYLGSDLSLGAISNNAILFTLSASCLTVLRCVGLNALFNPFPLSPLHVSLIVIFCAILHALFDDPIAFVTSIHFLMISTTLCEPGATSPGRTPTGPMVLRRTISKPDMAVFERAARRTEERRFVDVPIPLHPRRWSLEAKEEMRTVWAPIQLPDALFPDGVLPLPPTLEWGFPITLQDAIQLGSMSHSQPRTEHADDRKSLHLGSRYLTDVVGCVIHFRVTLNAPYPGGIVVSLSDNYNIRELWRSEEITKKHIGRLSTVLGLTDGFGPRWYVNATQPNWRYDGSKP